MFYLSIALIGTGLLFIVFAIAAGSSGKRITRYPEGRKSGDGSFGGDTGAIRENEGVFSGDRRPGKKMDEVYDNVSERQSLFSDEMNPDLDGLEEKESRKPSGTDEAETRKGQTTGDRDSLEFQAVFFEDNSSVIGYGGEPGSIDPSLEEYKKIKRVGRGTLVAEKDGMNFYLGKKFFRFDFHRVRNLMTGNNYIALITTGGDTVKLFIIDDNRDRICDVDRYYRDFIKIFS
jgi:hypothetical protein